MCFPTHQKIAAMKAELFSRALTVTPNIPEAEALTGISIASDEDRRQAARAMCEKLLANTVIELSSLTSISLSSGSLPVGMAEALTQQLERTVARVAILSETLGVMASSFSDLSKTTPPNTSPDTSSKK